MTNTKIDELIACVEALEAARHEYADHCTRGHSIALGDAQTALREAWRAMELDDVVELVGMVGGPSVKRGNDARRERIATAVLGHIVADPEAYRLFVEEEFDEVDDEYTFRVECANEAVLYADALIVALDKAKVQP